MRHIKKVLQETFIPHVDVSDLERTGRQIPEHTRLSRALAAFALTICAELQPDQACELIVDGFQDNGIDAVFHDEDERCVYLVQSKWMQNGGGLDVGEVGKLIQAAARSFAALLPVSVIHRRRRPAES